MIVEKAKVKKNDTMESLRQHSKLWQAGTVRLIEGRIIIASSRRAKQTFRAFFLTFHSKVSILLHL